MRVYACIRVCMYACVLVNAASVACSQHQQNKRCTCVYLFMHVCTQRHLTNSTRKWVCTVRLGIHSKFWPLLFVQTSLDHVMEAYLSKISAVHYSKNAHAQYTCTCSIHVLYPRALSTCSIHEYAYTNECMHACMHACMIAHLIPLNPFPPIC